MQKQYNILVEKVLNASSHCKVADLDNDQPQFLISQNLMLPVYEDIINHSLLEVVKDKFNINIRQVEAKLKPLYNNINTVKLGKLKLSKLDELKFLISNKGYYLNFTDKIVKESLKLLSSACFQNSYIDKENNILILKFFDHVDSLIGIEIHYRLIDNMSS